MIQRRRSGLRGPRPRLRVPKWICGYAGTGPTPEPLGLTGHPLLWIGKQYPQVHAVPAIILF